MNKQMVLIFRMNSICATQRRFNRSAKSISGLRISFQDVNHKEEPEAPPVDSSGEESEMSAGGPSEELPVSALPSLGSVPPVPAPPTDWSLVSRLRRRRTARTGTTSGVGGCERGGGLRRSFRLCLCLRLCLRLCNRLCFRGRRNHLRTRPRIQREFCGRAARAPQEGKKVSYPTKHRFISHLNCLRRRFQCFVCSSLMQNIPFGVENAKFQRTYTPNLGNGPPTAFRSNRSQALRGPRRSGSSSSSSSSISSISSGSNSSNSSSNSSSSSTMAPQTPGGATSAP